MIFRAERYLLLLLVLVATTVASAQADAVHFSVTQKRISPSEVDVIFSGSIDNGWHVYSVGLPSGGPTSATLTVEHADGAKANGALRAGGKEISIDDPVFGMRVRYFEHSVQFVQRFTITGKTYNIKGYLEYGACNDHMCLPPQSEDFSFSGKGLDDAAAATAQTASGDEAATSAEQQGTHGDTATANSLAVDTSSTLPDTVKSDTAVSSLGDSGLWAPVVNEMKAFQPDAGGRSLWYIFLMGILGGLVALLTPCVWPVIPMTVSFFLHRSDNRRRGIRDAILYGISIIVIYMALAFIITAIFGPRKLNELATNAPFNIFFFLLLLVFALSFFGCFELTLPSSWGNKVDTKASKTTGLLSIFLMAFTLSLVSFSCTAPVVGFLLVEAATSSNWISPAVGMFGFALALALPFTLFAMFPTLMKRAPKSGAWMNTVKILLGFIELAFSLKFLSVADLAYGWHILDRETFLALWIAIFTLAGLYLIGVYHFRSDGSNPKPQPVVCIMLGLVSLAFAIYMVPGLFGAPCKAVSAFAPPMYTQDFVLNKQQEVRAKYNSYEEGMAAAKAQHKPVLLDFTGFGCVNCRKMEAAVWTDPTVAKLLSEDYVLISLYVDDKTPLSKVVEKKGADGKTYKLRTVGDKWSYLEETKFGFLGQPYYVPLDNEGKPLCGSFEYKEDAKAYADFLNKGIEAYKKKSE